MIYVKPEDAFPHSAALSASHHHLINTRSDCPPAQPAPPPVHSQWEGNNYSHWIQKTSDNRLWLKGKNAWPASDGNRSLQRRRRVVNLKKASERGRAELLFRKKKKNPITHSVEWRYTSVTKSSSNKREDMTCLCEFKVHFRLLQSEELHSGSNYFEIDTVIKRRKSGCLQADTF